MTRTITPSQLRTWNVFPSKTTSSPGSHGTSHRIFFVCTGLSLMIISLIVIICSFSFKRSCLSLGSPITSYLSLSSFSPVSKLNTVTFPIELEFPTTNPNDTKRSVSSSSSSGSGKSSKMAPIVQAIPRFIFAAIRIDPLSIPTHSPILNWGTILDPVILSNKPAASTARPARTPAKPPVTPSASSAAPYAAASPKPMVKASLPMSFFHNPFQPPASA